MQATRNAKNQVPPNNAKYSQRKLSPTTATSSGQDIQAHVGQSDGDITATIRPRGEANVGPTKAVQPPSRPIRRPRTPPPGPARHRRVPTATERMGGHGHRNLTRPLQTNATRRARKYRPRRGKERQATGQQNAQRVQQPGLQRREEMQA